MLNYFRGPLMAPDDGASASTGTGGQSGQASGTPAGQPASSGPAASTPAIPAGQSTPFHSWTRDDGSKMEWATADDLNKFLRDGVLMRDDYTKKTQSLASERKQYESDKSLFQNEYNQFLSKKQQYDKYDEALKGLTPQEFDAVFRQLRSKKQQSSPEVQALRLQIQQIEARQRQADELTARQKAEERRSKVLDSLAGQIQGFDKDAVLKSILDIQGRFPEDMDKDTREDEEMRAFAELVHFAGIGRQRGSEVLSTVAENLKKKQAGAPPAPGAAISTKDVPETSPRNMREAAEMAKKKLGLKK